MILTAYDFGFKPRSTAGGRRHVSASERRRRQRLCRQAVQRLLSHDRVAKAIGAHPASVRRWDLGGSTVPACFVAGLYRIAQEAA